MTARACATKLDSRPVGIAGKQFAPIGNDGCARLETAGALANRVVRQCEVGSCAAEPTTYRTGT
jgi:hypothetical protein